MNLFVDFETYWDSKTFTLKKQSVVEYVRDPRFKAFGLAYSWADKPEGPKSLPTWVTGLQIANFCSQIAKEIGWSNITLVGHNIKFDGFILHEIYKAVPGKFIDTKGMSKAVLGKSVKSHHLFQLADVFGLPSKGTMKTDGKKVLTAEEEAELASYCLHDVWLCRELYKRLKHDFPENQYASMSQTVSMFVRPRLMLNVPLLEETTQKENLRRETIFKEIGIDKKEFASNKKFPQLLEKRGYEVPTKCSPRRNNNDGTPMQIPALALGDQSFLDLLESPNKELRTLCEARVAAKSTLLETRSLKLAAIGSTGPWPFDVEFSGAAQTHRFSGGSGAGGNPQNFTRDSALREAVEAPKGYSLVVGDFANIELRIVAYLSKDPGLVQSIEQGIDLYCDFASVFYGRKITKADEKERRFGKTAILGLGYNMGWKKFIKTVKVQTGDTISDEDAQKAVNLYRNRYSKVPALWKQLDECIAWMLNPKFITTLPVVFERESIRLPSHLRMRYPGLRQEDGEWIYDVYNKGNLEQRKLYGGKLLENISQGLAGEICKEAMVRMGDSVVGQVHDELLVLCKKGTELMTAQKLKRVMGASPAWLPEIRLSAEVSHGSNWLETK